MKKYIPLPLLIFLLLLLALASPLARAAFAVNDFALYTAVIDTAGARDGTFLVDRLEWCPSAVDDDLIILDGEGSEIWRIRAAAGAPNCESYGKEILEFSPAKQIRGLDIDTIDGGTLYIFRARGSTL